MEYQLKTRQICFFNLAFLPIIKFFMLPSVISGIAQEDMWISTILNISIDLITVCFLLYFCKTAKTDFYGLLTENFGKKFANTVFVLYAVYFLLKSVLPITEQKDYIEITLYITFPQLITFLPFFVIAFYLSLKHLRVLGRAADVLWIITILGFVLLFSLSISNVDLGAIMPIGAQGVSPVIKGAYTSANWYGDGVYLLFFAGNFKYKKGDTLKLILSYIGSFVMVIIFMIMFYGIFSSIAFRQRFALTEISKYSTVINSVGRFDFIGIFFLLTSNFISLSLPIYFSNYCISKVLNIKKLKWIVPLILSGLVFSVLLFFGEYFSSIETFFLEYANIFFFIFGNIIPILVSIFVPKRKVNYEIA